MAWGGGLARRRAGRRQANILTGRQADRQAGKHPNRQAGMQAGKRTGSRQAGRQAGRLAKVGGSPGCSRGN